MRWLTLPLLCLACGHPPAPEPMAGPLKAGVATVALDAPVGISLGGYSRHKRSDDRGSAFALDFPASTGVHTQPTARALALDDGLQPIVLVRIDAPLVTNTLQHRAQLLLGADAKLVVAGTHSHAAPARFFRSAVSGGTSGLDVTAIAMDKYDAELEDRLARSIVAAAKAALDARVAVSVGHAEADGSQLNSDRRCQNDDLYGPNYKDGTMRVLRFDVVDADGKPTRPLAGLLDFAVHGTVLGSGNTLQSTDAPGAIEAAASRAVGVPLLFLQGSAGDVSPHSGGYDATQALEHMGLVAAPLVAKAFEQAAPGPASAHATLKLVERGIATTRAGVGYAPKEFPEFGAVGCGLADGACQQLLDPKTIICLPLSKTGVTQEPIAALRIEDAQLVLLPGEPTTAIGARIREAAVVQGDIATTWVVGYAMDHAGYLLEEPDYLRGGYEPSVSPWGWKFGDYLVAQARVMLSTTRFLQTPFVPQPVPAIAAPRTVQDSAAMPAVVDQPADLERLQTAVFSFTGGEPGLGTPRVVLERDGVEVPEPGLVLHERTDPSFAEDAGATVRTHTWRVDWETMPDTALGTYRLVASGVAQVAGEQTTYRLESAAFAVAASKAAGAVASASWLDASTLALKLEWPAHPVRYGNPDDPIGNFRWREPVIEGGGALAEVTSPTGAKSQVRFIWSDSARAFTASLTEAPGHWMVDVPVGGFTSPGGDTNGAPVHVELNL